MLKTNIIGLLAALTIFGWGGGALLEVYDEGEDHEEIMAHMLFMDNKIECLPKVPSL
jgi:hypothetical protein